METKNTENIFDGIDNELVEYLNSIHVLAILLNYDLVSYHHWYYNMYIEKEAADLYGSALKVTFFKQQNSTWFVFNYEFKELIRIHSNDSLIESKFYQIPEKNLLVEFKKFIEDWLN